MYNRLVRTVNENHQLQTVCQKTHDLLNQKIYEFEKCQAELAKTRGECDQVTVKIEEQELALDFEKKRAKDL